MPFAQLGDEIQDPAQTIPRALVWAMLLVIVPYILTILAATGVDADIGTYHNGRYNDIAEVQGGAFLGGLFAVASVASVVGMFVSDVAATSFTVSFSPLAPEGGIMRRGRANSADLHCDGLCGSLLGGDDALTKLLLTTFRCLGWDKTGSCLQCFRSAPPPFSTAPCCPSCSPSRS